MDQNRVKQLEFLENQLGLCFNNKTLLNEAFVHRSYANFYGIPSNERLEFLGDSVLSFSISEILYRQNKGWDEGLLTRVKSQLVSRRILFIVANSLSLSPYILVAGGLNTNAIAFETAILGNALESLIGAIYLSFGYETTLNWIGSHFKVFYTGDKSIEDLLKRDYKSQLQVYVQKKCMLIPMYELVSIEGPEHKQIITSEVSVDGWFSQMGTGKSRKQAEQIAAKFALELLINKKN